MGSCVAVLGNSNSQIEHGEFTYKIFTVGINESRCPVAVNITDVKNIYLKDINISDSHGNFLQATQGFLTFEGINHFYRNQGAFSVTGGNVTFKELSNVVFANNSAVKQDFYNSVLYLNTTTIFFLGSAIFINNTGREGGAIVAYGTSLHYGKDSTTLLYSNSADNGGAMRLNDDSFIIIDDVTDIDMRGNKAQYYGGGLFVEDKSLWHTKT